MQESALYEEHDIKAHGVRDIITEQDNGIVKFDIGSFVLCHRKLSQLIDPFAKCYESFVFVTRWRSQKQSLVVMLVSIYLSFRYPVYLLLLPLVYSVVILSLAAVKKLGSKNSKGSVNVRTNKVKRKEDDVVNLELKRAAMKQAHEDLHAYINISIQIQTFEENCCAYLEQFYRICRWEDTRVSKICLLALLLATFILVFLPGRYLITVGIIAAFIGNSDFEQVFRRTVTRSQLTLEHWKKAIYSRKYWITQVNGSRRSSQKSLVSGMDSTENDFDDEWYDAEQETSQSDSDSFDDENDAEDDEDTPTRKRRARLFSGLSMVTHFTDYRKKQKRINSGNCASCDVSFSSLLKKRQYCRHCGGSFCSRCCSKRVKRAVFGATAPAAYEETVLVCKSCYGYLMNKTMNTDIW